MLLATGARALAICGRWEEARSRLASHRGIGRRMLDGRQVAVIARLIEHDTNAALTLLHDTLPGEPAENAVTACLTLMSQGHGADPTTQLSHFRELDLDATGMTVFHTRLALSFIDALDPTGPAARSLTTELITRTLDHPDGYTSRDLLAHPGCSGLLTYSQYRTLKQQVDVCGLDTQTLPRQLHRELDTALDTADRVIQARHAA